MICRKTEECTWNDTEIHFYPGLRDITAMGCQSPVCVKDGQKSFRKETKKTNCEKFLDEFHKKLRKKCFFFYYMLY
ncbi:hypothetical protein B5E53_13275 [Eubacterium sp. An11]|nr:hypothetical protein B5E53_13275 [Eubacterium sp. An11]